MPWRGRTCPPPYALNPNPNLPTSPANKERRTPPAGSFRRSESASRDMRWPNNLGLRRGQARRGTGSGGLGLAGQPCFRCGKHTGGQSGAEQWNPTPAPRYQPHSGLSHICLPMKTRPIGLLSHHFPCYLDVLGLFPNCCVKIPEVYHIVFINFKTDAPYFASLTGTWVTSRTAIFFGR